MAACAAGPPRPMSEFSDPEPVIDFESDPRLSEADRVRCGRWLNVGDADGWITSGLLSRSLWLLACDPVEVPVSCASSSPEMSTIGYPAGRV